MFVGLIVAVVAVVVALFVISLYNRLVRLRNGVENAFASIDVQLKQRCDLIPKVVEAMREYMSHERGTLDELTALREKVQRGVDGQRGAARSSTSRCPGCCAA